MVRYGTSWYTYHTATQWYAGTLPYKGVPPYHAAIGIGVEGGNCPTPCPLPHSGHIHPRRRRGMYHLVLSCCGVCYPPALGWAWFPNPGHLLNSPQASAKGQGGMGNPTAKPEPSRRPARFKTCNTHRG